ncbi:MAG: phosphate ABC transporter permease PstA [Anaerolineae bacterium]|nr:phosphate ABC transporter permease PstA [Anaerolineae bacterium]
MEYQRGVSVTTGSASVLFDAEQRRYLWRKAFNGFMTVLITLLTVAAVGVLVTIVVMLAVNGIGAIKLDLFIKEGIDGGIAHAILGTLEMLAVAALIAVPLGIATAIYLAEYAKGWFADVLRSVLDLLAQLPSIVVGLFVWSLLIYNGVVQRSGIAGAIALAVIMLPIVARSVEEILKLVPDALREGALALGTPRWRVIMQVVMPTVLPGVLTGVILAMARAAGETAPLLLTALGNEYFEFNLSQPMAAVPVQLFKDATYSTDPLIQQRAWAAGLILILVIAVFSASVRFVTRRVRYDA